MVRVMLVAVILLGMGSSKGKMRTWLRHPMLTGVLVWSVAHLLVNGDRPSLVLFAVCVALYVLVRRLDSAPDTDEHPVQSGPWIME